MLERWGQKNWWGKIAAGLQPVARCWKYSPGGWLGLGVLVVFGALAFPADSTQNQRRQEIAAAYGAATTFYGQAQLSHDGSRLAYVATTPTRSCALYLQDLNSRQTREVVSEHDGLGNWGDDYELRCWPWSPDDRWLVYTVKDKLIIYPPDTPTQAVTLTVGQNAVSQLAWLAPGRFALVNQNRILTLVQRQADGVWKQFGIPYPDDLTCLTAVDSNTVAWLQKGLICRLDLDEYGRSMLPAMMVSPNTTISWSHNVWGFDRALPLKNKDVPVANIFAGVILSSNWNDSWSENAASVKAEGVTVKNLYASTGTRTAAGLTYAAWNGACMVHRHIGPDADGTFNRELLNGFLNAGEAKWNPPITNSTVAFTNLPFETFDAIVYFGGDAERRRGRISDGNISYYFSTVGPPSVSGANGIFMPTVQTNEGAFPMANYALFAGLTNRNPVFTCVPLSGNDQWLGISAVQIIQASNVFIAGGVVPQKQTSTNGQPARFNVLAGGLAPRFQWRHEGVNLLAGTNAVLNIPLVKAGDAGGYDVIVANDFGSVTSSVAQLIYQAESPALAGARGRKVAGKTDPVVAAAVPTNGLVLWLDASTLQQSNQTPVTRLKDLSPRQNHALEYNHAPLFNAPDSVAGLNGRGTIQFAFAGSLTNATGLKTSRPVGIAGAAPRTIFAVMRRLPARKGMFVSLGNCGAKGEYCGLCDQEHAAYLPAGMVTDNALPALAAQWNILSMVYDGVSQKGFVNGVLKGESTFPMRTPDNGVEIGLRKATGGDLRQSGASDGDFAELLIYDRPLEAVEQQQVENHLARKWFGSDTASALDPLLWVNPPVGRITGFSYSAACSQWLLRSQAGPTTTLWQYDANGGLAKVATGSSIQDAGWITSNQFAYIRTQAGRRRLMVGDTTKATPTGLFPQGNVNWLAPDRQHGRLLFFGAVSNEPAGGLWQYDLIAGQLLSLVAYSDHPSAAARRVAPFAARLKTGANCSIYPPARIDPRKKYPLVITDTLTYDPIHGPMFQSGLADCGAYVAIVERNSWYGGIEQWPTNVLELYQKLKRDPAIDGDRIYLYAASAETQYLSDLVEKIPGLWRGIMLLNPSRLPDFSQSPWSPKRPKILICAGSEEHAGDRIRQYQTNALSWGVVVDYLISPGEAHRFIGKAAKQQRLQKVSRFIFEE